MGRKMTEVQINEIYYSIQGEGVYTGLPTTFVRLQGCNLYPNGCSYCDTAYAQSKEGASFMSLGSIEKVVKKFAHHYKDWVCITGGEPLLQEKPLHELVKVLKRWGLQIEIETNGTLPRPFWWTLADSWVVDVKCPSSGVTNFHLSWERMRGADQAKFVVSDRGDLEFVRQQHMRLVLGYKNILISPAIQATDLVESDEGHLVIGTKGRLWLQEVAGFSLELRLRYNLQIHKVIWGNRRLV